MDTNEIEQMVVDTERKVAEIKARAKERPLTIKEQETLDICEMNVNGYKALAADFKMREQDLLKSIVRDGKPISGYGRGTEVGSFLAYLRSGTPMDASLVAGTDANGGYVVPEPIHQAIVEKVRKVDPIFGRATHFDISMGDTSVVIPYKASHGVATAATETDARTEQNAPTFAGPTVTAYDIYTDQRATQQVLDSVPNLEELLIGWIVEDILEQLGTDLAVGDGNGKSKGLFAATTTYTVKPSGNESAIANTNFISLFTALDPKYRANAAWLMNSATFATVMAMSHPAASGYDPLVKWDGDQPMILGKPVLECTSAPGIAANAYPVAFGDIAAAYAIADHRRASVLRDPYTVAPYVRFYGLARMGGAPWDPQACLLLKVATS